MSRVYSAKYVMNELSNCIDAARPFSLIRFGDGGLKLIKRYFGGKTLFSIARKEGIPLDFFDELISLWRKYANEANFIDTPEVYLGDDIFSNRNKVSHETRILMEEWREIYKLIGFENKRYCNPEIGYLMLDEKLDNNLIDLIRNRKICCVTNFYEIEKILSPICDVRAKLIPGFFGNFYDVCYESVMREIEEEANKYSLWLIGAGELGRVFTGKIKECGGRALDIGKVFDILVNRKVNKRMRNIVKFSEDDEFRLKISEKYES